MELFVIRHPAVDVSAGICYGQLDVGILPGFESLIDPIRESLRGVLGSAPIYSSHLTRCRQLAHLLDPGHRVDPRIAEMSFGNWEGKSWEEIPRSELEEWMREYLVKTVPGGESFADVRARVGSFLKELSRENDSAVLVSHAGVIRSLMIDYSGIAPEQAFRTRVDYGSVHRFEIV